MKRKQFFGFFQKIHVLAALFALAPLFVCAPYGAISSKKDSIQLTGEPYALAQKLLGLQGFSIDFDMKKDFFEYALFDDKPTLSMDFPEEDFLKKTMFFQKTNSDAVLKNAFNQSAVRLGMHHKGVQYSIALGNALYDPLSLKSLYEKGKYMYTDIKFRYYFNASWAAELGAVMCVSKKKPLSVNEYIQSEDVIPFDEKQNFSDFSEQVNSLTKPMGSVLCETFFSIVYYFCNK